MSHSDLDIDRMCNDAERQTTMTELPDHLKPENLQHYPWAVVDTSTNEPSYRTRTKEGAYAIIQTINRDQRSTTSWIVDYRPISIAQESPR